MEFLERTGSVVFVGEGFTPSLFKAERHVDLLGEPDANSVVVTPVVSQQVFPASHFRVLITPDRIEINQSVQEPLSDSLMELSRRIADRLKIVEAGVCKGIGINDNVLVADTVLGRTGTEFCREHFIAYPDLENKLRCDEFSANTAKLLYLRNRLRYMLDVEPEFRSGGKNLLLKMNVHQDVGGDQRLEVPLEQDQDIRSYVSTFYESFLGVQS